MSSSTFGACLNSGGSDSEVLQCIAENLENLEEKATGAVLDYKGLKDGVDIFFLIFAAALMFFMQGGFAMLCAGCVREKNIQNTMLKNLLDACGAALSYWAVGFAFSYGGGKTVHDNLDQDGLYSGKSTFIGTQNFFLIGTEEYAQFVFEFAFAATASTIVAGTLAERCQMAAYLCYSIFLVAFIYPVIVHAAWARSGFLSPYRADPIFNTGFLDFAGSGVVHLTGGLTSLIASKILGPRKGRFYDEKGNLLAIANKIEGHSSSLQCLGTFMLWFGWYGFNAGSVKEVSNETAALIASVAVVATTLGAAAGGITTLCVSAYAAKRQTGETSYQLADALNGCLAGLVSITGGCGMLEPWAAALVGGIGGLLYLYTSRLLVKFKIDDAVEAIPVHFSCGVWGVVAVGFFASPRRLQEIYGRSDHVGWCYSWGRGSADATLLGVNLLGILFIIAWVFFTMTPFFLVLSYLGWFRADSLEEIIGLDPKSNSTPEVMTDKHLTLLQQRMQERTRKVQNGEDVEDTGEDTFNNNS